MARRFAIALAASLIAGAAALGDDFFFPDRPGDPLPEPRIPHRPRIYDPLVSPRPLPAGGFKTKAEFKAWATDTVWEFLFPEKPKPGQTLYIVRVILRKDYAEMTWDGGRCGWWTDSLSSAKLRHSKSHWTYGMRFAADYQSFRFSNHWGTAKLVGRIGP